MRSPSVRQVFIVWPFLLFFAGCSFVGLPIRPPAPDPLPAAQNPVSPAIDSVITFPVRADLTPFLNAANDQLGIPKSFDHWGSYVKGAKGIGYKYYAERDDFSMTPSASGFSMRPNDSAVLRDWWKGVDRAANVSVSAPLRYKIGTHGDLSSGGAPLQCGEGGQWPRRALLNGDVAIDLTPNYGLAASITGVGVNPIDPCALEVADVNVTKEVHAKLAEMTRGGLNGALASLSTVTFKSQVEEAWEALRKPIQLNPDIWLLLNIEQIGHAGFSGRGPIVDNTIQMRASPTIIHGEEPDLPSSPLPQLGAQLPSNRFRVVVDTQLEYEGLSKMLVERLKWRRISNKGDTIVIVDASISGNGGNQVVIRIDFRGDARGHAYFVGRPQLNLLTQTIYISDLRYDHETGRALEKSAEWLYTSNFRELIAYEAVLGMTSATNEVRKLLAPLLNRRLSQAIIMEGRMTSVQGISVFADANALSIRSMAEGTLGLTVKGGL